MTRGGGAVCPPPPPRLLAPPPPPHPQQADSGSRHRRHLPALHLTLTSDQVAFAVFTVAQLLVWRSQRGQAETAAQNQPLVVAALTSVGLVFSLLLPRFFCHNRAWLIPCFRLLVLLVPSARATKVGSALILEREPAPGLAGVLVDLLRLSSGTRVILLAVQGLAQVLPPLSSLVTQTLAAALTWNSRGYCTTALLTHPLTQQRTLRVAAALELGATLPFGGNLLPHLSITGGALPPEAACRAFVSFFHVAGGILLPFLVSTWFWRKPLAAPGGPPLPSRWQGLHRLTGAAAAAAAQADVGLHALIRRPLLVAWHLLALTWLGAKVAAGLP